VDKVDRGFQLNFKSGDFLFCNQLLISCGGFPKLDAFNWISKLGHTILPPVPSLFTFNLPKHPITSLMGLSVGEVKVQIVGHKLEQHGPLLITHWGFSGPCILKLSAWGARLFSDLGWQFSIRVNWIPQYNENSLRDEFIELRQSISGQSISNRNPFGLPSRLWEFFIQTSGIDSSTKWGQLSSKHQQQLIRNLVMYEVEVSGKTGFKEEFVTAGGVSLKEIDPLTMMSKMVPGLFFSGEIMDVDGVTGGFNFQHAWASAWIASKAMVANASNP
jgi:hypothetical protein